MKRRTEVLEQVLATLVLYGLTFIGLMVVLDWLC